MIEREYWKNHNWANLVGTDYVYNLRYDHREQYVQFNLGGTLRNRMSNFGGTIQYCMQRNLAWQNATEESPLINHARSHWQKFLDSNLCQMLLVKAYLLPHHTEKGQYPYQLQHKPLWEWVQGGRGCIQEVCRVHTTGARCAPCTLYMSRPPMCTLASARGAVWTVEEVRCALAYKC